MSIIVAAIDASDAIPTVLNRAIEQARFHSCELHAVHVFQPLTSIYGVEGPYLIEEPSIRESEEEALWRLASPILDASGVKWLRVDLVGHPVREVADYASEHDAILVVVGTRGRGELTSLLLGSTSHGLIHDLSCDVLVVKSTGPLRSG